MDGWRGVPLGTFSSTLEKIFEVRSGESFGFAAVFEILGTTNGVE
jgi:hypothetical protein